jgi:hypothetical protein
MMDTGSVLQVQDSDWLQGAKPKATKKMPVLPGPVNFPSDFSTPSEFPCLSELDSASENAISYPEILIIQIQKVSMERCQIIL